MSVALITRKTRRLSSIAVAGAAALVSLAAAGRAGGQSARPSHTADDVKFMQNMISHHAQALERTALVPTRTTRQEIRLLAERIEISQKDEISLMQRWLTDRHELVPDTHGSRGPDHHPSAHDMAMSGAQMPGTLMPGMLTAEQLSQLASKRGPEFDRLFLEDMIRHHEGALVMVKALLGTNGAAQEPEIFRFTSDIDADQRAEIMRMRALLSGTSGGTPRR
jgi:uncharacterized protein (DUF305 family)